MTRKQTATTEDWIAYGKRVKAVYDEIVELLCDPLMQESMTIRDYKGLNKARDGLIKFKSDAENAMFKAGKQPQNDPLAVFYGEIA